MNTITSQEVEAQLPDKWWAENDGDQCVHAYNDNGTGGAGALAGLTIERVDDNEWEAAWMEPGMRGGMLETVDVTTGSKESVIRWVSRRAGGL